MQSGAYMDLAKLHRVLDEAVVAAYDWPAEVAQNGEELKSRIWNLNQQIGQGNRAYAPSWEPKATT